MRLTLFSLCLLLSLATLLVQSQQPQLQQALLLALQRNPSLIAQIRSNPALISQLQRSLLHPTAAATPTQQTSLQRQRKEWLFWHIGGHVCIKINYSSLRKYD
jgi:hypothetical protein